MNHGWQPVNFNITEAANAAFSSLAELWQEIGFSAQECQHARVEIYAEVQRLFNNKITACTESKSSLNSQIRLTNARYSISFSSLRIAILCLYFAQTYFSQDQNDRSRVGGVGCHGQR